jgi:hypothetical protein
LFVQNSQSGRWKEVTNKAKIRNFFFQSALPSASHGSVPAASTPRKACLCKSDLPPKRVLPILPQEASLRLPSRSKDAFSKEKTIFSRTNEHIPPGSPIRKPRYLQLTQKIELSIA